MLFVSLPRFDLLHAIPDHIHGVELRLDLWDSWDIALASECISRIRLPVMCTLRSALHGGRYKGSEEERERKIIDLLKVNPAFFDLEYDMRPEFLQMVIRDFPDIKLILSYHNFEMTPLDLEGVFNSMSCYPVFGYKIAALALSTIDALRMLIFGRKHPKLSMICMGERGQFARVLGPVCGNVIDYASLNSGAETATGQISASELIEIYRYQTLNQSTAVFGLIGNPVAKSQGHIYHNEVFANRHLNAVYVKMILEPEELVSFFPLAKEFGIRGLSVTMPLKESVLAFVDGVAENGKAVGSVNTLLFIENKIFATNTDGQGALDAIEKKMLVRNKILVLIGAGGAARGIAYEAIQRGAIVWILNRTLQKAQALGKLLACNSGSLAELPSFYDVLINCSPDPMSVDTSKMRRGAITMDIVYVPKETLFLQKAQELGCPVIYGEDMFRNQAALQTAFWIK